MLLIRTSRIKTSNIKDISRSFLSHTLPKKYHSAKTDKKCFLKLLHYSRCENLKFSSFIRSNYRTLCYEAPRAHSLASDNSSLNTSSKSFYVQHPDVAKRSEDEIKEFRWVKEMTVKGENVPKPITKFSELCLPEHLMSILNAENYIEPTPIQSQGWPIALSGRDMVGVSQTGSGKTLAYMLPAVIHSANMQREASREQNVPTPKVLVLGPTRELVQQIHQVSRRLIEVCNLRGACVYGGASRIPQLQNLRGADICIATPGRLLDYIDNKEVIMQNCSYLVLDEADRMLDMGFEPQIRAIIEQVPRNRQTLMWSATWPTEIRSLAEDFLTDYIHVTIGNTELVANPNIHQNIYVVNEREKFEKFYSLLSSILENGGSKVLVFAETKKKVDYVVNVLKRQGIKAWAIHGNCSQNQRDKVLNNFRRTTPSVLIATDIASRGLDISNIHHVINYDFPLNIEDYIHRIGRTARGSACGESHSFFTHDNSGVLRELLSVLKKSNQIVNPELLALADATGVSKSYRSQKKFHHRGSFYNRSFGKDRMYM